MSQIPGFDYSLNYHCDYSDTKTHIVEYLNKIEINKIEISTSDIKLKELNNSNDSNDSNDSNLLPLPLPLPLPSPSPSPLPFSANNPESDPAKKEQELWRLHHSYQLDKDITSPPKEYKGIFQPLPVPSLPPYYYYPNEIKNEEESK